MGKDVVIFPFLDSGCFRKAKKLVRQGHCVLYKTAGPGIPVDDFRQLPARTVPLDEDNLIELTDAVFNALILKSKHHIWATRFFGSSDIDFAFCGFLKGELGVLLDLVESIRQRDFSQSGKVYLENASFFMIEFMALYLEGRFPSPVVKLIPEPICRTMRLIRVKQRKWTYVSSFLGDIAKSCGLLILRARCWRFPRKRIPLAIRTYPTDLHAPEAKRLRAVDFSVDCDLIRKEEVVFFGEGPIPEEKKYAIAKKGYHIVLASEMPFDLIFLLRRGLWALLSFIRYRTSVGLGDCWPAHACLRFYYHYVVSQAFMDYFGPTYFLTCNDLSFTSTIRNIVIRRNGCRSIFLMHSCNWLIGKDGQWSRRKAFAYLVFDILVSWGRKQTLYHKLHPGRFAEVWELGCLWSEHVRLVHENTAIWTRYLTETSKGELGTPRKKVGVMDTSVVPLLALSAEDLYCFLVDCVEMAKEFSDVLFLYKPKNSLYEIGSGEKVTLFHLLGERGENLKEDMETAPNFIVLPELFETSVVTGLADVTISACFSSPTVEAIGAGKKGIFYDPTDRFPNAFWSHIPGMVCNGKQGLKDRLHELLYGCSAHEYHKYIQENCGDLEGYFDGYGISRLRHRLLEKISDFR